MVEKEAAVRAMEGTYETQRKRAEPVTEQLKDKEEIVKMAFDIEQVIWMGAECQELTDEETDEKRPYL